MILLKLSMKKQAYSNRKESRFLPCRESMYFKAIFKSADNGENVLKETEWYNRGRQFKKATWILGLPGSLFCPVVSE